MGRSSFPLTTDLCPLCRIQFLKFPTEATGFHNPVNKGRLYQVCGDNNFSDTSKCRGFIWCSPAQETEPVSWSTMQPSPPNISTSAASPRRRPQQPCGRHCGQSGNALCIEKLCRACCLSTSSVCKAPRHNREAPAQPSSSTLATTPTLTSQTIGPGKSFAQPISSTYAQKLMRGDFSVNHVHDAAKIEQYRLTTERQIKCYWWNQDNQPPKTFMCPIPNAPFFHPKDDAAISAVIGAAACNPYSVLIGADWVTTTAPQRVKINDILYLRSVNVTICIGGPFTAMSPTSTPSPSCSPSKRRLSESSVDQYSSPAKIIRHLGSSSESTPSKIKQISKSSASDIIDLAGDSEDEEVLITQSVTSTPTSKPPFPRKWACEMDQGFRAFEAQSSAISVPKRFEEAFGSKWARNTFYTHKRVWDSALKEPTQKAQLEKAIKIGKLPGGDWHSFYKIYHS